MMIYLACWAMDLNGPHGFQDLVNELQPAELKLFVERLDDREAMERRPSDRPSGKAELLKIVAEEEERLEEVLELHLERDEAGGLEPLLFDDSESGERLRRYQLACNRTLLRILDTLERRQRARGKARAEPAAAAAADRPTVIAPPPAAASTPQDTAGPPVPEDRMPAIDEPAVLDDEPDVFDDEPGVLDDEPDVLDGEPADASSAPSAGPADECPAPAEIAAPVEPAGAASVMKLPAFPGETATEGRNSQNEPNEPAGAAGGRALDGLAALLALLKLAVVVLFAATAAVKGAWAMALESPFRKARLAVVGWAQPGTAPILSGFAPHPVRYQPDAPARVGPSESRTRSDTSPTRQRGSARPDRRWQRRAGKRWPSPVGAHEPNRLHTRFVGSPLSTWPGFSCTSTGALIAWLGSEAEGRSPQARGLRPWGLRRLGRLQQPTSPLAQQKQEGQRGNETVSMATFHRARPAEPSLRRSVGERCRARPLLSFRLTVAGRGAGGDVTGPLTARVGSMSQELHYTSVARGLKPGSRGFGTVAATASLPDSLADRLEGLSAYQAVFPPGDPSAGLNPVDFVHVRLSAGGQDVHVLSRIGPAGLDYSGRPNKYAHHIVLGPWERPEGGPAWLLSQPGFLQSAWEGEPRILAEGRPVPAGDRPAGIAQSWLSLTGDAGWAGVLAESFLADPRRPVFLVFRPGIELLPLFVEAIALLPSSRRWDVEFSTYLTNLPPGVSCTWRGVLEGSAQAKNARRLPNALIVDLCRPIAAAQGGALVHLARTGERLHQDVPAAATPSQAVGPTGSRHGRASSEPSELGPWAGSRRIRGPRLAPGPRGPTGRGRLAARRRSSEAPRRTRKRVAAVVIAACLVPLVAAALYLSPDLRRRIGLAPAPRAAAAGDVARPPTITPDPPDRITARIEKPKASDAPAPATRPEPPTVKPAAAKTPEPRPPRTRRWRRPTRRRPSLRSPTSRRVGRPRSHCSWPSRRPPCPVRRSRRPGRTARFTSPRMRRTASPSSTAPTSASPPSPPRRRPGRSRPGPAAASAADSRWRG